MIETSCQIADCKKPARKRGWCDTHYARWRKHGDPTKGARTFFHAVCAAEGCEKRARIRGLCEMHRRRVDATGRVDATKWGTPAERFWKKIDTNGPGGCWLWIGSRNPKGYGQMRLGGRKDGRLYQAHRIAYELLVGPIADGMEIDHLCRVRNCVNPEHLEPVTHQTNILRRHLF